MIFKRFPRSLLELIKQGLQKREGIYLKVHVIQGTAEGSKKGIHNLEAGGPE